MSTMKILKVSTGLISKYFEKSVAVQYHDCSNCCMISLKSWQEQLC